MKQHNCILTIIKKKKKNENVAIILNLFTPRFLTFLLYLLSYKSFGEWGGRYLNTSD